MKITDVKTWVVGNPPPGIGGKYFIFVKLTTDGGVVGYGEAYNATFSGHVTISGELDEDEILAAYAGRRVADNPGLDVGDLHF